MMFICLLYIALMLLCICRTFSIGTDVIVSLMLHWCYCAMWWYLVLRVLEPEIWHMMWLCHLDSRCCESIGYFVSHFFSFSSGIVNSILSHICGRLYFPMFLFRVGLLTLMNMASLMVLAILFSSLPRILKLSIDVIWPLAVWWWKIGERCLHMLLESLSQGFSQTLPHILHHSQAHHSSKQVDNTTLVSHLILIFWWHEYVLQCSVSFEINSYAIFSANVFHTLTNSWCVRNDDVAPLCRFVGSSGLVIPIFSQLMLFKYFLDGPIGILAMAKCFFQMFQFCFQIVLELSRWCVLCVSGS